MHRAMEHAVITTETAELPYPQAKFALLAARQLVERTGDPVTVSIFDVVGTTRVLKAKLRCVRQLDGQVTFIRF